MRRREFIKLLGAAVTWPGAVLAQSRTPRIGILALGNPDPQLFIKEFREGLRELGYIDGQNISKLAQTLAELLNKKLRVGISQRQDANPRRPALRQNSAWPSHCRTE